ncbi:divalent cation tolerance protein [Pilimelia anulata]|uniref:Divalent cation tolerance protein n=1 Tax=Pilimelia anulata TaxID=53371 RepID=A0A8J3AYZ3_9ACTN|nr:divalent-cation tolerance protein CutA [Pilimelia anulata]GGJ74540.1 divalent cation tolerance protein [Pilimelia anulata]
MAEPAYCQVTTTIDSAEAAAGLARAAVEARLVACARVAGPVESTYWWEGRVETAREWVVVAKTTDERYPALEALLRERHPYDVPEIIRTPVTGGSPAYLAWISAETSTPTDDDA